jgi:VWFA-related protein
MLRRSFLIATFPLWLGTLFAQSPVPSPTASYSESKTYVPRPPDKKSKGGRESTDRPPAVSGDGSLTLAVAVYDKDHRQVTDLQSADFSVFIDGTAVDITAVQTKPESVDLILLLDRSTSVEDKTELVRIEAEQIVEQVGAQDTVTVIGFGLETKVAIERSKDKPAIVKAIRKLGLTDGTNLYDIVAKLAHEGQGNLAVPTALVVVSDGVDTTSKHKFHESLMAAERSGLVVFWVYINTLPYEIANIRAFGGLDLRNPVDKQLKEARRRYEVGTDYINDILTLSGGLVFDPARGEANIAREMRDRYYLKVRIQKDLKSGERHAIKVRVKRPGLLVLSKATLIN